MEKIFKKERKHVTGVNYPLNNELNAIQNSMMMYHDKKFFKKNEGRVYILNLTITIADIEP